MIEADRVDKIAWLDEDPREAAHAHFLVGTEGGKAFAFKPLTESREEAKAVVDMLNSLWVLARPAIEVCKDNE